MQQNDIRSHTRTQLTHANPELNLFPGTVFSFPAVSIRVLFAGFICNLLKSHGHRTRDVPVFSRCAGRYMLIQVPATPQHGKHGYVGPALHWHNLQLERA